MAPTKHRDDQLFQAPATFAGAVTFTGAVTMEGGQIVAGRQLWIPASIGRVGATAGWLTAEDGGLVRCPASETAVTFTIPILGLHLGDTLTGVSLVGQVESAGNNGTMVMSVRKQTAAAADFTDAELDSANMGTITEDTLLSSAGTPVAVTGLTEVLAEGEHLYALLTATTGVAVDIAVAGLFATYTQS